MSPQKCPDICGKAKPSINTTQKAVDSSQILFTRKIDWTAIYIKCFIMFSRISNILFPNSLIY